MKEYGSFFHPLKPVNRFQQFLLPRAGNPSNAQDFPAIDIKGNMIQLQQALFIANRRIPDLHPQLRLLRLRPVNIQGHSPAHHHIGHLRGIGFFGDQRADIPPRAKHRHLVGQSFHFVQLVRNDHDGFPVVPHIPQHREKLVRFLRRQHGGRLVQNQDIRSAVQHLHNLHRLFLGNGHIVDLLVRIHIKPVGIADLPDLPGRFLQIQFPFQAQHDIFRRTQNIH